MLAGIDANNTIGHVLIFEADDCNDRDWKPIIKCLEKHMEGFEVRYADGDYMNFVFPLTKREQEKYN